MKVETLKAKLVLEAQIEGMLKAFEMEHGVNIKNVDTDISMNEINVVVFL